VKALVERICRARQNLGCGILAIDALALWVADCGARLAGIGCMIEKTFEGGRQRRAHLNAPIVALAVVESMDGDAVDDRNPAAA